MSENIFEIHSSGPNSRGEILDLTYREGNPLENMEGKTWGSVQGWCFYGDSLVVVHSINRGGHWSPPGGRVEEGESIEEAIDREVAEESNMRVLSKQVIGYQDIILPDGRIIRSPKFFCFVEPIGEFKSDPDGSIDEIKLIDPKDYKEYFDWGEVGERVMARALEIAKENK
jgi:ADP-ribose pyrophosphatase YjhB (NUDIX family)